jgi:predicted amidohydrolase
MLTIAVAQPVCRAHDVAANAHAHAAAIRAADARVVVFPELSLTGYEMDAVPLALDDPRLVPITEACAASGSVALVGAPVAGPNGPHIAQLRIDGSTATIAYRKMNLASEESRFVPGDCPAVVDVDGWRLGLGICRDTGLAEHALQTARLKIDAYVAGTLMFAHEKQEQDGRARRIATTHGIAVAFASFAGPTGNGYTETAGCSAIWAADGSGLAQAGPEPGLIARAVLTTRVSAG